MKKLFIAIMVVILAFSFTACVTINVVAPDSGGEKELQTENNEKDEQHTPQTESTENKRTAGATENEENSAEGQPQQSLQETEELYSQWMRLVGYWNAAEGRFALPDMMDSHTAYFAYGMWDTEYYREGIVTYIGKDGEEQLFAKVDADGEVVTVLVDYSGLERDGKMRIKIGDEDWMQCMFAGNTWDEAYQTYIDNTYGG